MAGTGHARLRKSLVVAQVTLSLLLLIGAGLFIRSLRNLRESGAGIQASNLISFTVDPSLNGYDGPRSLAFFRELNRNLGAHCRRAVGRAGHATPFSPTTSGTAP